MAQPDKAEALKREFRAYFVNECSNCVSARVPARPSGRKTLCGNFRNVFSATEHQLRELGGGQPDKAEALEREL